MMIAQASLFIVAVISAGFFSEGQRQEGPANCNHDGRMDGPDDCYHNGVFYPIYSKWASTIPNDCQEMKCHKDQKMTSKPCKPEEPYVQDPGFTCYPINISYSTYPYCCPKHYCVQEYNP